jgi:carboxyl-terminal processing protease
LSFLFIGVSFKNDFFEIAKQIEIFTGVFKTVNQNYVDETNAGELMDIAIKNMLKELDPYTVFFNEQDVLKFKINNTGEYTGIGAMVQRKDGKVYLKEIYKGFPADKAGLKAGDEITQIGDVSLKEYKEDASQLLKGAKNTQVTIQYIRQGKQQNATIILNEVEIKAVPYYALLKDKTGYIVLSKFNEKASAETKAALLDLKQQGATKIILDLRGNPGGLLHEAVNICNLFVAKNELIVTTKSKNTKYGSIVISNVPAVASLTPVIGIVPSVGSLYCHPLKLIVTLPLFELIVIGLSVGSTFVIFAALIAAANSV